MISVASWGLFELHRDKTNKMACAPSEDSDQPGHLPSLIRDFAVCMKKVLVLSYPSSGQRRLWLDWADAQIDLSLRWSHMPFCWFCHVAAHLLDFVVWFLWTSFEHVHNKTNKMTYVPSEDSDQSGHPPSLIRVFAVCFMGSLGPMLFHVDSEDSLYPHWAVILLILSCTGSFRLQTVTIIFSNWLLLSPFHWMVTYDLLLWTCAE